STKCEIKPTISTDTPFCAKVVVFIRSTSVFAVCKYYKWYFSIFQIPKDKPAEKVAAFKSLTVPIPEGSLHDRSTAVQTTLGKIGGFASSRTTDTILVVAVDPKDRKFVEAELNQGIASALPSSERGMKVGAQKTPTTQIKFVSLKKGAIPTITVAPVGVVV
ncbi:MAG: hypothetical protein Q7U78_08000, partial [Gallionella sp.]|nr:hypothetical protein [Gallionella sp.]